MRSPSIAEYDQAVERLIARVEAACESEPRWTAGLLRGLEELLAYLGEDPPRARLLTGGVLRLPGGPDRHHDLLDRFARLLRSARDSYPGAAALPKDTERVLVAGISATLSSGLTNPTAERPLPLAADLAELALAPYAGAGQAHAAIEYELGRRREGRKGLAGLRLAPEVTAADQRRRLFAAYEDLECRLRALVFERAAEEPEWPDQVRAAVVGALRFFASEPRALLFFAAEGDAMQVLAEDLAEGRRFTSAQLPKLDRGRPARASPRHRPRADPRRGGVLAARAGSSPYRVSAQPLSRYRARSPGCDPGRLTGA